MRNRLQFAANLVALLPAARRARPMSGGALRLAGTAGGRGRRGAGTGRQRVARQRRALPRRDVARRRVARTLVGLKRRADAAGAAAPVGVRTGADGSGRGPPSGCRGISRNRGLRSGPAAPGAPGRAAGRGRPGVPGPRFWARWDLRCAAESAAARGALGRSRPRRQWRRGQAWPSPEPARRWQRQRRASAAILRRARAPPRLAPRAVRPWAPASTARPLRPAAACSRPVRGGRRRFFGDGRRRVDRALRGGLVRRRFRPGSAACGSYHQCLNGPGRGFRLEVARRRLALVRHRRLGERRGVHPGFCRKRALDGRRRVGPDRLDRGAAAAAAARSAWAARGLAARLLALRRQQAHPRTSGRAGAGTLRAAGPDARRTGAPRPLRWCSTRS